MIQNRVLAGVAAVAIKDRDYVKYEERAKYLNQLFKDYKDKIDQVGTCFQCHRIYAVQDMTLCQLCKKTYTCPVRDYCEKPERCHECGVLCCAACNNFCDGFGGCENIICLNCSVECIGCDVRCKTCFSKPHVYENGITHHHVVLPKEKADDYGHALERYNLLWKITRKNDTKRKGYTIRNINEYLSYSITSAVKQRKMENINFIETFEQFIGGDATRLAKIRECCICQKLCFGSFDFLECFGDHVSVCIQCEPVLEKKFPCSECQKGLFCEQCIKDPYEESRTEALWICSYLECENKVCLYCANRCPKCNGCICSSHGRKEHSSDCEEEESSEDEFLDLNPDKKQKRK